MKIHSIFTHHYTDGGVGEAFESTKHFRTVKSNTIEVTGIQFFKCQKTEKNHNMPPYCSCGVIQVSVSPDIQF